MPAPDPSTVAAPYKRGLELARGGAFFEAHEAFEAAWRASGPAERDFFQGLVHVVVSAYQRERGRPVAEERQRVKALARLAAFAPAHRGLDVSLLLEALRRAEADPREHLVERDPQPPVAVEEEEQPEHDERAPGEPANDDVVVADPTEGAHRVCERDAGGDEGRRQAE
jgi:predicted metal-dependent hydrolase